MLTKIEDVPSHVAAFKATGKVDKHDYDNILIPELNQKDKEHGHLHMLMLLETPVKNFTLGAWMEDAWMGLRHFRGWRKIAIVTNEIAVEKFTNKFSFVIPGKARGFKLAELEAAKQWVAEEDDDDLESSFEANKAILIVLGFLSAVSVLLMLKKKKKQKNR
ncbi:MAG: STAS/SEC14 domain-containing protein [Ferruginibacter sp.]